MEKLSSLLNVSVSVMNRYYNKNGNFQECKAMMQELQCEKTFLAITNDEIDANAENFGTVENDTEDNRRTIIGELHNLCGNYATLQNPAEITRTIRTTTNNNQWNAILNSDEFRGTTPIVPRHVEDLEKRKQAGLLIEPSSLLSSSPSTRKKASPKKTTSRKSKSPKQEQQQQEKECDSPSRRLQPQRRGVSRNLIIELEEEEESEAEFKDQTFDNNLDESESDESSDEKMSTKQKKKVVFFLTLKINLDRKKLSSVVPY